MNGSETYKKILKCTQNEKNANQVYTEIPIFTITGYTKIGEQDLITSSLSKGSENQCF